MTGVISSTRGAATPQSAPIRYDPAVAAWLFICAALVLGVVVVGGITRLTHSGLSIVEWAPIMGAIPPITSPQWTGAFEKYQRTPEYQVVNRGMSLEAFKRIFWVEWVHRLLGRLIGVVFLVPFVYWWARGLVAGTRAGFAYNTFPLMGGRIVPEGLYVGRPVWTSFFEGIATVQFNHRLLAGVSGLAIAWLWWMLTRPTRVAATRAAAHLLLGWLGLQITLGIVTLLYVVPVPIAVAHQGSAVVLFGLAVLVRHRVRAS